MTVPVARLSAKDYNVRLISLGSARRLVEQFHYSRGCSNTATYRHGLFKNDTLFEAHCVGCALWLPPTRAAAEATYKDWQKVLCLSRLVIQPGVPSNAASFLLGASMRLIDRRTWPCLVTYADEWRGHTGAIYRATNWTYIGLTKAERVYVKDGRMLACKHGPTSWTHDEMLAMGAACMGAWSKHKFVHTVEAR